jgi:hypothetical protein
MAKLKNLSIITGLALIVAALIIGLFVYIRSNQVTYEKTMAKQKQIASLMEYKAKLYADSRALSKEARSLAKEIADEPVLSGAELERRLNDIQTDCEWSLKGLAGKVNPAVRYDKAMKFPPGGSATKHEQCRNAVKNLLTVVTDMEDKPTLTATERASFAERLNTAAGELEESTRTL